MLVSKSMRTGGTPSTMSVRGLINLAMVMFGAGVPRKSTSAARVGAAFAADLSRPVAYRAGATALSSAAAPS